MRSMTGCGRGESARNGLKITVELSSVNRKQGEVALSLPRELEPLESRVRDAIHQQISRGRLTARVSLHWGAGAGGGEVRLNVGLAKAYVRELRRLAVALKLDPELKLEALLRVPGVIQSVESVDDAESFWPLVEAALGKALKALVRMRDREGAHLGRELKHRMALIRAAAGRVRRLAPEVQRRYLEQLRERVQAAGLPAPAADDERVLKELVYFADRSDVTEELTRLESHFAQFEECLASTGPVGRTLDFLAQEINREINTIGSKANDARLSREVVVLKTELEKFREQVQNVE